MNEPRPRQRGRSRDASAAKASPKTTTDPSRRPAGSTVSRDASRRAGRAAPGDRTGNGPSRATQPRVSQASRDASAKEASPIGKGVPRRGADRSTRSRDASRRAASAPPAERTRVELASSPTRKRSRDASATTPRARTRAIKRAGFICPPCGRFVPTEVDGVVLRIGRGSPPRFCSPGCRQAAYRRRRAGVAEDVALQLRGGRDRSLAGRKGAGDE